MKRFLALALTVIMLLGITCIAPVSVGAEEIVTVYYVDYPDNFENVYVYAWTATDGGDDIAKDWPGMEMSPTGEVMSDGGLVYSYTFEKMYENIIFSNGAGTQTADLEFVADQYLWFGDECWYESLEAIEEILNPSDNDEPVPDGEYTVYYVDSACFETAYAYAYNSDEDCNAQWPGVEMTLTDMVAVDGSPVYSYTSDKYYDYIIFNDGYESQTADLEFMPDMFLYWSDEIWYETLDDLPDYSGGYDSEWMTIFFQNNWLWSDVKVYFWGSELEESEAYPGGLMGYYDNDGTYDIYSAVIPADIDGFLFTGIKNDESGELDQTPDITEGFYDGICYYMMWDNGNDVGYDDISVILPDTGEEEPEECEHSFNSNGVCIKCGGLEDGVLAGVSGYSLSLGGNIGVNQYVAISDEILYDETANVVLTLPATGSTYELTIPVSELEFDGKYYKVTCEVAAKELASEITMEIKTDSTDIDLGTFAASNYCYSVVNGAFASDELKAVAKSLLNYSAASQLYFDYNTDNLANKDLSEEDKIVETADLSAYAPVIEGEAGMVSYYGASLTLKSETSLNFYFRIDNPVSGAMAITVNGIHGASLEKNGNLYQFTVKNISAHMLGETYVLETGGETITYSPLSYAYTAQQSSNEELVAVANALYAYYDAVRIFA